MLKNIRGSHTPVAPVRLLMPVFKDGGWVSVNGVVGVFQPPALTIWMFSWALCPQLEYVFSFFRPCSSLASWIEQVTGTISLLVNHLYLQSVRHCWNERASRDTFQLKPYRLGHPSESTFCWREQGKGKNCKIRQESCLWGARTQLLLGAGGGSPCLRQSCDLQGL